MNDVHRAFLTEHLPYEIDMLDWTYKLLQDPKCAEIRRSHVFTNMAIECFWLHARNLIVFLRRKSPAADAGEASASHFTVNDFVPLRAFKEEDQINVQVSHLKYERPSNGDLKLNTSRMTNVYEAIHRALREWGEALKVEYADIWRQRSPIRVEFSGEPFSATNVITTTSTALVVGTLNTENFTYRIGVD
jgi:hypothetical protein